MLAHLGTPGYQESQLRDNSRHPTAMAVICQLAAMQSTTLSPENENYILLLGLTDVLSIAQFPAVASKREKNMLAGIPERMTQEKDIECNRGDLKGVESVSVPVLDCNYRTCYLWGRCAL